jgi:tRNA(fMet)-specific endonuclease VapC
MIYILDTNILILRAKSPKFTLFFEEMYVEKNAILSISIVTLGEIESLMLQNNWGEKRRHFVQNLMSGLVKIDIHRQSIIDAYAQIDAYSQGIG